MSDDWRLRIELGDSGLSRALTNSLEASELEHDLESAFHQRVVVSTDDAEVFCYADAREQVERAERLIRSIADQQGWQIESELSRWHPDAEEWVPADQPLPSGELERSAERAELMEEEREESIEQGYPEYEVRVQCRSRREAAALADKLRAEALPSVHRWKYLLIGAPDEDSANALAERLRGELPADVVVTTEGNLRAVMDAKPTSPFAFLGGLGA
jgi:hypothetical protein